MRRAAALLALVALVAPPTSALAHARAELVTDNLTTAGLDSTTTGHEGSVLWTQKDPLGFAAGDTSLYVYGLGDPVSYVDPSGEICFIPLIFLAIKAADMAMNAYDTYQTAKLLMDPCVSNRDKAAELALLAAQWAAGGVLVKALNKLKKAKFLAKFGCFAAGTLVATSTGLVPIESIEPGAIVQSRNDTSGAVEWRAVTANHVRPDVPTLALGIEDEREGSWLLTTTAEHPIYVESVGYVPAGRLEPGQWLVTESGASSRVVSVAPTGATQTVYNLTVEGTENYFVGPSPVLVHNSFSCTLSPQQLQAKFKHAEQFGVKGNYNRANAAEFGKAIQQHVDNPAVRAIEGTYRGDPVLHHLDAATGLNVITDRAGNFISGWKLSPEQLQNVATHGGL